MTVMSDISNAPMDGPFSPNLSLVRAADAVCSAPRSTTAPPPVSHPSHPDREGEPAVEQQHVVRTACSRLTADPPFSPVTLGVECQTSVEIPHFTTVPGPGSNMSDNKRDTYTESHWQTVTTSLQGDDHPSSLCAGAGGICESVRRNRSLLSGM